MKLMCKFATLTLMFCAVSENSFAVNNNNLVRGVIGLPSSNPSWSNYSVIDLIPGSALFPGSRGSLTISAVTPVTYHGISHPSIDIGTTTVCPAAPSATTPCIVRFDPISLTLSPTSDYYFVVHFSSDTNNGNIAGTQASTNQSSLSGVYLGGTDSTQLTVGESIPSAATGGTTFLMYVMNN